MRIAPSIADKRRTFHELHESGCFVLPNPWDVGSALYLQSLGFKALATTSSGLAWSEGRPDNALPRERVLAHLAELAAATDVPLNADFESGFAAEPAGVLESVRLAVQTGIAGLSIEDSTGQPAAPLHEFDVAVERIRAARRAIDRAGGDVLLVGRTECLYLGPVPGTLAEAIARLEAFADAGADCLFAPGIRSVEEIRALVAALSPKPINLLMAGPGLELAAIAALGVRRVSVGGAFARTAWGGFMRAAQDLAAHGSFAGLAGAPSHDDLDALFAAPDEPQPR
jgi:2-methylisocitrate lyase-like PEP mutase family enzyme